MSRYHVLVCGFAVGFAACAGDNKTFVVDAGPLAPVCSGNGDATLTADELPVRIGVPLNVTVSEIGDWDLRGSTRDGVFTWQLDAERATDVAGQVQVEALNAQWYAPEFPRGQFVVSTSGIDGIYQQDALGLWLLGSASREAGANQTLIIYSAPLAMLRYPLAVGDQHTQSLPLVGSHTTINGLPFVGTDAVTVDVVASGRLQLPYVAFTPTVQVRTAFTRTEQVTGQSVTLRSTSFLFECAGELVHADAALGETDPAFTRAVVRRFAL